MAEPIIYIDRSEIRDGKLEELKGAIDDLIGFVDAREPQLISYGFFIDEAATRVTLVAVHPDSASLEFHMEVAGPAFRRFTDLINLLTIQVYGRPSDKVLEQLQQKAKMLGEAGNVSVDELHAGFARFRAAEP